MGRSDARGCQVRERGRVWAVEPVLAAGPGGSGVHRPRCAGRPRAESAERGPPAVARRGRG
eukprot:4670635-Lingulodinium_polyedra.AAC.1